VLAAEHRYYRTKRERSESPCSRKNQFTRWGRCLKTARQAPKSSKQKGKLAQRPNSSTVNPITSARREVRRARNREVTDPHYRHPTRGEKRCKCDQTQPACAVPTDSCAAPNLSGESHADPLPERNP
jgi:hypothetical protein